MAAPESSDCQHFFDTYLNDMEDGVEPYVVLFKEHACGGDHFSLRLKNGQVSSVNPSWVGLVGSLHVPKHIDLVFRSKQLESHLDGEPSHEGTYKVTGRTLVDVHSDLSTRYALWGLPEDVEGNLPRVAMHPGETDGVSPGTPVVLSFRSSDTLIDEVLQKKPRENFKSERTVVATDGTISRMHTRRNKEWDEVRFESCTGVEPLVISGQDIRRYQPGSEFCTDFVRKVCIHNPHGRDQCSCHQEQKELPHELSPVDFGQRCHRADEHGLYVPPELAEIRYKGSCEEAIREHSDVLDRMGYADIHCRGETYHVDQVLENKSSVHVVPLVLVCLTIALILMTVLVAFR